MSFIDLVSKRYSVRSYEERQIDNEKMEYIMKCVRMAPSAVNFQPWMMSHGIAVRTIRIMLILTWQ